MFATLPKAVLLQLPAQVHRKLLMQKIRTSRSISGYCLDAVLRQMKQDGLLSKGFALRLRPSRS